MAKCAVIVFLAAGAAAACTTPGPGPEPPAATTRLVVYNDCGGTTPYIDTMYSGASTDAPAPGEVVQVTVDLTRVQLSVPLASAHYDFPVPAGVRITGVDFVDDLPHQWAVHGSTLTIDFRGNGDDGLLNDYEAFTITARVSPTSPPGTTISWPVYRHFEQYAPFSDVPFACTPVPPAPVFQTMTVR